jgi:hypothetical protein
MRTKQINDLQNIIDEARKPLNEAVAILNSATRKHTDVNLEKLALAFETITLALYNMQTDQLMNSKKMEDIQLKRMTEDLLTEVQIMKHHVIVSPHTRVNKRPE